MHRHSVRTMWVSTKEKRSRVTTVVIHGCIFFKWEIVSFTMGGPKGNDGRSRPKRRKHALKDLLAFQTPVPLVFMSLILASSDTY